MRADAGTVTVEAAGAFKYKPTRPTHGRRIAGVDFDYVHGDGRDGQGGMTPVTVQVAVLPGVFENSNTPGSTLESFRRGDRR